MSKTHISWPSIEQYRSVVQHINKICTYTGKDDNGDPIYNENIFDRPTITFIGTVKIHGTNAAVCHNKEEGLWFQSRTNIITPLQDNAGFAGYMSTKTEALLDMIQGIRKLNNVPEEHTVAIFGEWAGEKIQTSVAMNQLPKSFYVFGIKSVADMGDVSKYSWLRNWFNYPEDRIYNISEFETHVIDIDFKKPDSFSEQLQKITNAVENECPVAKYFGVSGIGEGVVWRGEYDDQVLFFKVKGDKHSISKTKTGAEVRPSRLEDVQKFVEYAVTNNRMDQAILEGCGGDSDMSKIPDYLRWLANDIMKEENDVLVESNLTWKEVAGSVSRYAVNYFKSKV